MWHGITKTASATKVASAPKMSAHQGVRGSRSVTDFMSGMLPGGSSVVGQQRHDRGRDREEQHAEGEQGHRERGADRGEEVHGRGRKGLEWPQSGWPAGPVPATGGEMQIAGGEMRARRVKCAGRRPRCGYIC